MLLLFNSDRTIVQAIDNGGEYVEKIFVGYSPYPWTRYNSKARDKFVNKSDKEILKKSKYYSKIELVEGVWDSDEGQRNEIVKMARDQGFDYLVFQDADEFYSADDWRKNFEGITRNPDYMIYQAPWINFWKSTRFVLVSREHLGIKNTIFTTCSAFAMNLKKEPETKLTFARVFPTKNVFRLTGLCFHLSYVLSDEEVFIKIGTWGHSHQVNKNWFKWKWLAWHPGKRYLNPISSAEWVSAVPYTGTLPSELADFLNPTHVSISLTWYDRLLEFGADMFSLGSYQVKQWRSRMTSKK